MSTLYLVSTPIGNLNDITLRAIETLKNVDIIACEDTRHSIILLNHYDIKKPLISYHQHNERIRTDEIIQYLNEGKSVALITDAGSPCISDPGAIVVEKARQSGFDIKVIPGASAVISAVSLAGLSRGFVFLGFIPEKKNLREKLITNYKNSDIPVVFYSSVHNINKDIQNLYDLLGNRRVYVIKELTKIHEGLIETRLKGLVMDNPKGEYVLIIMPDEYKDKYDNLPIKEHVLALMNDGLSKKDAIKKVQKLRNINKNIIYQEVLDIKDL